MEIPLYVKSFLRHALVEDIGNSDITSSLVIDSNNNSSATIVVKEEIILSGLPFLKELFNILDPSVTIEALKKDGEFVEKNEEIVLLNGRTISLLKGERTSLNILQRLSGIATLAGKFVEKVKDLPVKITDTRKTTPNMRFMEKYAVRTGGGYNHRFGLYDGILIKDNHIKAAGGIRDAIRRSKKSHFMLKVEVEIKDFNELKVALEEGVDIIMLDNMAIEDMREAVKMIKGKGKGIKIQRNILIEASGNVSLGNVREIAMTGVDIISAGCLTHSATASDMSMEVAS